MASYEHAKWQFWTVAFVLVACHVAVCQGEYGGLEGVSKATWYGEPEGSGTDGGACAYGPLLGSPYGAYVAAGSPPVFQEGEGCGACYVVQCLNNLRCSSTPITVVVTDLCPGGEFCGGGKTHFDLSGKAFGALALPGKENELRQLVGVLNISYKRTFCKFSRTRNIIFRTLNSFDSWYLPITPMGVGGPGTVHSISFKEANSNEFRPLQKDWGASFTYRPSSPMIGPFSVQITANTTNEVITCPNKIPTNFNPGEYFDCGAQFSTKIINNPDDPKTRPPLKKSPPKTPFPNPQPPKPQFRKPRPPKPHFPVIQPPKPQFPKTQPPKPQFPKPRPPKPQFPKPQAPKPQFPKPRPPKPQFPKTQHPKSQFPKPQILKPQFPKPPNLKKPPRRPNPPISPPNDVKRNIQISQKLLGSWVEGSNTIYHYVVDVKNIGTETVYSITFKAENLNLSGSYNLVILPDNKYTLKDYVFPLLVGNSGGFGYFNIGGEATFFIL